MLQLCIIGAGYVGLVSGACLAKLGHHVTCLDRDSARIEGLKRGIMPIYEPGLAELVAEMTKAGRLRFGIEKDDAAPDAVFLAVGTPPEEHSGAADLRFLLAAAEEIAAHAPPGLTVVTKSTVPVGTGAKLAGMFPSLRFASNPEFLREGVAIEDFLKPERIVIGTADSHAQGLLRRIYAPLTERGVPLLATGMETAELIKYASNAFLATKVAFINQIADICEAMGADVEEVARGMGLDSRIGSRFLRAGPGYGGSCFPKDTLALLHTAEAADSPPTIIRAAVEANTRRRTQMVKKITTACGGSVAGKTLAILGLAFKPKTDDMRESPAMTIIGQLLDKGAIIRAYDPQAMEQAKALLPGEVTLTASAEAAMQGADAAVIITEWEEFAALDMTQVKTWLRTPLLIDLRNLYSPAEMAAAGITYISVGRPYAK